MYRLLLIIGILISGACASNAQQKGPQLKPGFPLGARHVALIDSTSDKEGNTYYLGEFRKKSLKEALGMARKDGENNKYIVKYDANDSLIFAKTVGGSYFELFDKIAVGPDGKIYVTGVIYSDQIPAAGMSRSGRSPNEKKFFVAVFTPKGVADWAVFIDAPFWQLPYEFEFDKGWVFINSVYTGPVAVLQNKNLYFRAAQ